MSHHTYRAVVISCDISALVFTMSKVCGFLQTSILSLVCDVAVDLVKHWKNNEFQKYFQDIFHSHYVHEKSLRRNIISEFI